MTDDAKRCKAKLSGCQFAGCGATVFDGGGLCAKHRPTPPPSSEGDDQNPLQVTRWKMDWDKRKPAIDDKGPWVLYGDADHELWKQINRPEPPKPTADEAVERLDRLLGYIDDGVVERAARAALEVVKRELREFQYQMPIAKSALAKLNQANLDQHKKLTAAQAEVEELKAQNRDHRESVESLARIVFGSVGPTEELTQLRKRLRELEEGERG